jgi:hypothetical protein
MQLSHQTDRSSQLLQKVEAEIPIQQLFTEIFFFFSFSRRTLKISSISWEAIGSERDKERDREGGKRDRCQILSQSRWKSTKASPDTTYTSKERKRDREEDFAFSGCGLADMFFSCSRSHTTCFIIWHKYI